VFAALDVCPLAPLRVFDQMALAALQVRRPIPLVLPIAMDTAVLAPQASDAWVDPDAVRLVFDLPVPMEAVRDSRQLASAAALELLVAHPLRAHPKLPLGAPPRVAAAFRFQFLAHFPAQFLTPSPTHFLKRHVAQDFPPQVVVPEPPTEPKVELPVAHSALPDESESEQARSARAY